MQRTLLKSKLHGATVTQTELYYDGSITIDVHLMEMADIVENERVQIVNVNNGVRFETYVIRGEKGSGMICLNGPAARLGIKGDIIHILSYDNISSEELEDFTPGIFILNEKNEIIQ
ncbi:aspartate 1-decarboxylase [Candidatus Latescibacterota bacterium]